MQPGGGQDAEREGRPAGVRQAHPEARDGSDGRIHRRIRSGSPGDLRAADRLHPGGGHPRLHGRRPHRASQHAAVAATLRGGADPAADHGRQHGGPAEFHPQDGPGSAPRGLPENTGVHLQPVGVVRAGPGDDRPSGGQAEAASGQLGLFRAVPVVRPARDLRAIQGGLLALPRKDVFPHAETHRTGGDARHHGAPLLYPDPPAGSGFFPSGRDLMRRTILTLSLFLFLPVAMAGLGGGCATLPKVSDAIDNAAAQSPPQILSSRGYLSPGKSKVLMERLKGSGAPTDIVDRYNAVIESVSGSPLTSGNKVTLLVDGPATYAAMFKAMENARDHIHLETYIIEDDESGRRFSDLLLKKRAEGVEVNLIYDSRGSFATPAPFFQRLRDGGVRVVAFNPINPLKARKSWRLAHPDHRKILIVDGKIAFTGGINISAVYANEPSGGSRGSGEKQDNVAEMPWRDTDVQLEGPVVAEFQKLFLDTWERQKGPKLSGRNYFPNLKALGK